MNRNEKSILRSMIQSIEIDLMQGVQGTLTAEQVQENVNARLAYMKAEVGA